MAATRTWNCRSTRTRCLAGTRTSISRIAGAIVTDTGSSNRTLLNNELLELNKPAPLQVGNHIQLGRTGTAVLTVLDLDLQTSRPSSPARKSFAGKWWMAGSASVGALLAIGLVVCLQFGLFRPSQAASNTPDQEKERREKDEQEYQKGKTSSLQENPE